MYATYADIDNEIQKLSDLIPEGKTAQTWVEGQIATAQSVVDAKLRSAGFSVPLASPVDPVITTITRDLACYRILRPNYTGEEGNVSEWVTEYKTGAMDLLNQIAAGTISIDTAAGDTGFLSSTTDVARDIQPTTQDASGNVLTQGNIDVW